MGYGRVIVKRRYLDFARIVEEVAVRGGVGWVRPRISDTVELRLSFTRSRKMSRKASTLELQKTAVRAVRAYVALGPSRPKTAPRSRQSPRPRWHELDLGASLPRRESCCAPTVGPLFAGLSTNVLGFCCRSHMLFKAGNVAFQPRPSAISSRLGPRESVVLWFIARGSHRHRRR